MNYSNILTGLPVMFLIVVVYEGVLMISCGIDTLIHFVWAQFNHNTAYIAPLASCLVAIVLCVVEIWSMREKADDKTRANFNQAIQIVADAMSKEQVSEIVKKVITDDKKTTDNGED